MLSGMLIGPVSGAERVKLDAGKLVTDPLKGVFAMPVFSYHPWAFDTEANTLSWGERFHLDVGAVLTPSFGFGGGVGVTLIRGLSVNLGYSALFVDALKDGQTLNETPTPVNIDPFRTRLAGSIYLALGLNFK